LPDLVKPPAPVILTLETVILPTPETVRRFPPLLIPPVIVNVSASEAMVASPVRVIAPAKVLLPEVLLKAPPEEIPEPAISKVSAAVVIPPEISRAAPEATVVLAVEPMPPSALAFEI
jgi:hypothetical protein